MSGVESFDINFRPRWSPPLIASLSHEPLYQCGMARARGWGGVGGRGWGESEIAGAS